MIEAVGKYIQIEPVESEKKQGLILTHVDESPKIWKVLSVGKETIYGIKDGDYIIIGYGLKTVDMGTEKIYLVEEINVIAKYS